MKKGELIDELMKQGYTNAVIRDMGYSMSTIKYRRAKMSYPRSYKRLLKRMRNIQKKLSTTFL